MGVLEALLPKLAEMLTDKYKLHKGAKEGIRYIRDELESMQAALEKVSAVPPDQLDKQVKLWAGKVREMSYSIEDTIDSFVVRVDATGECGSSTTCCLSTKSMLPRTCKARGDIAAEIERIKKEVEEVSKRRERYKVDSIVAPAPYEYDPRLLALYEDEAKLVGIDHSREEIIKLLSMEGEGTSEQKLKLVSIVGPGGMGKTTLANAVYQKLEDKFDCTAFVSVSLEPNVKNILSSVLRQVTSKIKDDPEDKGKKDKSLHRRESQKHNGNTETWSEKEVIDKIRRVLGKRRYLIVIDDIWDEQPWKLINCVLFENKLGSRVITTTRKIDVAKSCCSSNDVDGIVYELQPLSYGDSEQLFYHKIFGKDGCPNELKVVSKRILSDQEEEIPEDRQENKKEDALLSRIGPFGGNGGRARDIRVPPHRLESVTICSGRIVDSLAFSYTDHNGQQRSAGPWGGRYGTAYKTIQLGPSEYLIKVSGTIGSFSGLHNLINPRLPLSPMLLPMDLLEKVEEIRSSFQSRAIAQLLASLVAQEYILTQLVSTFAHCDCSSFHVVSVSVAGRATERRKAGFHHLHSSECDLVSCDL